MNFNRELPLVLNFLHLSIVIFLADVGTKDNINLNNAPDELKLAPLRASKRRSSQESSGSNGSSKEAKGKQLLPSKHELNS